MPPSLHVRALARTGNQSQSACPILQRIVFAIWIPLNEGLDVAAGVLQ